MSSTSNLKQKNKRYNEKKGRKFSALAKHDGAAA